MKSSTSISIIMLLSTPFLTSAIPQGDPIKPCTTTIQHQPPFVIDCTFKSHTDTATLPIDCHGCADLAILERGVGLACQTITTIPGTETYTSTVCSASATYRFVPAEPTEEAPVNSSSSGGADDDASARCTTTVGPVPRIGLSPTLTAYAETETETSSVECGGCVLATRHLGPGPVRRVTTTTMLPDTTTTTEYVCLASPPAYYG